jgi:hypothetical protein
MVFAIQEINYGIASRIGDDIFINKKIASFDKGLYDALIEHEQNHTSGYTLQDVKMDITNKQLKNIKDKYYKFILTHPSSWIEFLPIQFVKGNMIINPTLLIMYILFTLLFFGGNLLGWYG